MIVDSMLGRVGERALLASPRYSSQKEACLSLWVNRDPSSSSPGKIHAFRTTIISSMYMEPLLLSDPVKNTTGGWGFVQATLPPGDYQVVLEVTTGGAMGDDIAVDGVQVREGPCQLEDSSVIGSGRSDELPTSAKPGELLHSHFSSLFRI